MQKSRERALPLVYLDDQQKYTVGKEALEMISGLNGKVAVISVAGLYRTGKSYLLNRMLLNRSDGFGVGSTIDPCTKGIWIWGRPLVQKIKEEIVNVLVVDSQGLGSLSEDSNHDSKIFALTLLISSLFIYNSIGSIDENTLAGLGLIVNLSKHLAVKSNSEEIDSLDGFPSLFWVVRDFSLQLVDKEGQSISQKQYLENSLSVDPSSGNQGRNEVRKAITKFFKQRHCVTLVRPSTNEEDLQHLDKMDLDSLKPEFMEQVLDFRKAVMTELTPKVINGKTLSGLSFCEMLCSFVESVNQGGVPTIETTWKYICQQQCSRAFDEVMELFDYEIHQQIKLRIPMPKANFVKSTAQIRSRVQTTFLKLVGSNEEAEVQLRELHQRMDSKIELLKSDNRVENVKAAQEFVGNEFESIDRKIRSGDYKKITQLIKEMQLFQEYYRKKCPYQQDKAHATVSEFLFRKLCEGVLSISKACHQQESELLKLKYRDQQSRFQNDMEQSNDKASKERAELLSRVMASQKLKDQLQERVDGLNEQVERYRLSLEEISKERDTLEVVHKRENTRSINDLRLLVNRLQKQLDESKQEKNERLSSSDREILLLQNKTEHLEKNNQQLISRLKDQQSSGKQAKLDQQRTIKELDNRYETSKNALQCKVRNLDSLLEERINELAMSEAQKCVLETRIQDLEQRTKNIKDQAQQNLRQAKEDVTSEKQSQLDRLQRELNSNSSEWGAKIRRLESQVIERESTTKQMKLQLEKTLALMTQKVEFLKTESLEKQDSINKLNSEYLQLMLVVQAKNDEINQLQQELNADREDSNNENMVTQHELALLRDNLASKHLETVELTHQMQTVAEATQSLASQLTASKQECNRLSQQVRNADTLRKQVIVQQEFRLHQQMKKVVQEFETQKQEEKERVKDLQKNNERTLVQLKNFYEMEKERNEKKLLEETQKVSLLENETVVVLRDQYSRLSRSTEDEISRLRQELKQTNSRLKDSQESLQNALSRSQNVFQQQMDSRQKKIQDLEKKEVLNREEVRKLQKELDQERSCCFRKVQNITFQMSRKQKEILQLNCKKQSLEQSLGKKEQVLTELRREYDQELKLANDRVQDLKAKLQLLKDEHIQLKIESEKQLALSRQKNQFLTTKVSELIKQRQFSSSKNLSEKPHLDKNQAIKEQYDKVQQDILSLEARLEKTRKAMRDGESNLLKQISLLQKDKSQLQERLSTSEDKVKELGSRFSSKAQQYTKDLEDQREKLSMDKNCISSEYQKMKEELARKTNDIAQLESKLERDTSLLEEKIRFVQNQREQLKKEIEENRRKLEFMMNQLHKGRKPDDDDQLRRQTQNQKKFASQLEVLRESLRRKTQEAEEMQSKHKGEAKQLRDRNGELQQRLMKNEKQHKMNELLADQNDKLKKERDQMFLSHRSELVRQAEESRKKVAELEKRYKTVEKKNAQHTFNFQKEYAKWMMEKDSLNDKILDLEERVKDKDPSTLLDKKSSEKYRPFSTNYQMMKSLPYFERK